LLFFNLNVGSLSFLRENSTDEIILDVKLEDILEEKSLFNEEELRKSKELCAEEAMLRKEIRELETAEIEVNISFKLFICGITFGWPEMVICQAGTEKTLGA
jgi:hypothetical protein